VVTAAVLLAGACGNDDDQTAGDNAGKAAFGTTTTEPTTTTSTTTTTTEPPTTAGGSTDLSAGPDYETVDGPSGAGCTPGDRTTLPDGWWAGEVAAVEGTGLDLDLVCFFAGDAGAAAAAEDGAELTNDYYVRNNNARTFRVEFASGTTPATCVGTNAQPYDCEVSDVLSQYASPGASFPLVWVHISGGIGDYAFVQYTP
jgi:hypothetical protein